MSWHLIMYCSRNDQMLGILDDLPIFSVCQTLAALAYPDTGSWGTLTGSWVDSHRHTVHSVRPREGCTLKSSWGTLTSSERGWALLRSAIAGMGGHTSGG